MIATHLLRVLAFALACAACRVGDPLVDVEQGGPGDLRIQCNLPPPCRPLTHDEAPEHAAVPVQVDCAQTCVWETSNGDSEACPPGLLSQLPRSAHCMLIELQPLEGVEPLNVNNVDWQDANVTLHTSQPRVVELRGGKLQRVYFELEGPITLRMVDLEGADDLRISGRANAQGAPRVEIAAERCTGLSVNSADQLFPGDIVLNAGVFEDIDARAEALTFESVTVQRARLRANMITLTDVTLEHAMIDARDALFSAFVATDSELRFCGHTRLIAGTMARCATTTCEGSVLRMFESSYLSSTLDGSYELSGTSFENVQLAASAPTRIFAYGSRISSTQMCEHMEHLVLGTGATIKCSGCVESLVDNLPVCAVEEPSEKWLKNFCTGWRDADPLPLCSEDTPSRASRAR